MHNKPSFREDNEENDKNTTSFVSNKYKWIYNVTYIVYIGKCNFCLMIHTYIYYNLIWKIFKLKRSIYIFILFPIINVYLYIDIKRGTLCVFFLQLSLHYILQILVFNLILNWIDYNKNGTRKYIK